MAEQNKTANKQKLTKADVVLRNQREIAARIDRMHSTQSTQGNATFAKVQSIEAKCERTFNEFGYVARQNSEIYDSLQAENEVLKQEINYLALQNQKVFEGLSEAIAALSEKLDKLTGNAPQEVVASAVEVDSQEIADAVVAALPEQTTPTKEEIAHAVVAVLPEQDKLTAEEIAQAVVAALPAQEVISPDYIASKAAEQIVIPQTVIDYDELAEKVASLIALPEAQIDYDVLAQKVAERITIPVTEVETSEGTVTVEVDYDRIVNDVVAALPAQEVLSPDYIASKTAEQIIPTIPQIDVDELAEKVAEKIAVPQVVTAENGSIDSNELATLVAERIEIPENVPQEIDPDELADRIVSRMAVAQPEAVQTQTEVDYDMLSTLAAEKVVERIKTELGESNLVDEVIERIKTELGQSNVAVDEERIAVAVCARLALEQPKEQEEVAEVTTANPVTDVSQLAFDVEDLADSIAKKVGSIYSDEFEVLVDDEGCDSISKAVAQNIDYEQLASILYGYLKDLQDNADELDYEEIATHIADKITVSANINEDAIADKAAAVLSNYLPEFDTDEVADKVAAQVIPCIPAPTIDTEAMCQEITDRLAKQQEDVDYDIVIDDEGIDRICDRVKGDVQSVNNEKIKELTEEYRENSVRLEKVEEELKDIKAMLVAGAVVTSEIAATTSDEGSDEVPTVSDVVDEGSEDLITVSDIVDENDEEEDEESDEVIGEIVDDIDEQPVEGEMMPDGIPGISGGVDFANMMKYNRSFIARIIQGTDDQKRYYGEVKNALLSYKKVNSNIAWGAERFNKGRETIAKFKIRGKTLCLYLALDPNEFPTSVYHHVDVSDNKSMHGTPMMVKIKSPRGVKKAIRLIDAMLAVRNGEKRVVKERDYAAMYPYETIEELIEDGLVKDVSKNK